MSRWHLGSWLVLALLGGCASEVKRQAVELSAIVLEAGQHHVAARDVEIVLESGYPRLIRAGTDFVAVGRIAQGLVLRPTQTVLTVEGAHMHEAYAVLNDGRLVGFYLPVERAFSELPQATPFPLVIRKP